MAHRDIEWLATPALSQLLPHVHVDLLREALKRAPDSVPLLLELARALLKEKQFEESVRLFEQAATLESGVVPVVGLGTALMAMGDAPRAHDAFLRALSISPHSADALYGHARTLRALGAASGALTSAMAAFASEPLRYDLLAFVARELLEQGRADELLRLTERVLDRRATHTSGWHFRAVALAALGRRDEAAAIMDSRLIRVVEPEPPAETSDPASFSAALRSEILANETLRHEPLNKATRSGLQTRELVARRPAALAALLEIIRGEVEVYARVRPAIEVAGPASALPARVYLQAWATVLEGPGHQAMHIHPAGWISGVYYVSAPGGGEAIDGRGVLRVPSSARAEAADGEDWPVTDVAPRPGRLVLFPSYFPHRTTPTRAAEPRISVAFDVKPELLMQMSDTMDRAQ